VQNSTWTVAETVNPPLLSNGTLVTISGSTLVFGQTGTYELVFYSQASCATGWPDTLTGFALSFTGSTGFSPIQGSEFGPHYRMGEPGGNAALDIMMGGGVSNSYFTDRVYVTLNAGAVMNLNMRVANPASPTVTYQGTVSVSVQQLNNDLPV
jgi:hypothetical protein